MWPAPTQKLKCAPVVTDQDTSGLGASLQPSRRPDRRCDRDNQALIMEVARLDVHGAVRSDKWPSRSGRCLTADHTPRPSAVDLTN